MRIVLIGPQGSGKGTQGERLAHRYKAAHVATGDLLRQATARGSALGLEAKEYMDRGELVPDRLVIEMLRDRFTQPDATSGFVLDGFPRTAGQAAVLDQVLSGLGQRCDAVVSLEVPEDLLFERMAGRARVDDTPEAIRRRLQLFRSETEPLIDFYDRGGLLIRIDGVGEIDEVEERIVKALEARIDPA